MVRMGHHCQTPDLPKSLTSPDCERKQAEVDRAFRRSKVMTRLPLTILTPRLRETEEGELGNQISRCRQSRLVGRLGFTAICQGREKFPTDKASKSHRHLGLKRTEKIFNMGVSRSKICQTLPVVAE